MPYRNEVKPLNLFGDYIAGRSAALDQEGAQQANALRGFQVQRAQGLNALAQNPNATPEQYARAGDPAAGTALSGIQQQQQVDKQQALQRVGTIATRALSITDPMQRKGFLQQAVAAYGNDFKALGADTAQLPQMLAMPDDQLAQMLQQASKFAAPPKETTVAAGSTVGTTDASGKFTPGYTAPKENPAPGPVQEYQFAQQQGYRGTFQQWQTEMKRAGAQQINLPSGFRWKADGSMEPIPGGPADPNSKTKPPTEGDKKNAVLFSSMMNAEKQITDLEKTPGATDTSSMGNVALGSNPLTRPLQSGAYRKYESAALRWSANLLYLKSGATATPDEVTSTRKQFFPQPGDGPEVKAQKEQARQQEIEAVRANMVPNAPAAPVAPAATNGGWTVTKVP